MTNADAITEDVSGSLLSIRPLAVDDHRYASATWRESFKQSDATLLRAPWSMYKATVGKQIAELLAAPRTKTLGAYANDGKVIGWIAYVPGRSISTVHWVFTRHQLPDSDEKCRRRGVMTLLLEAAELGKRFAYTHRGGRRTLHHGGKDRSAQAPKHSVHGPTLDTILAEKLRERGITVVYVPINEWLK